MTGSPLDNVALSDAVAYPCLAILATEDDHSRHGYDSNVDICALVVIQVCPNTRAAQDGHGAT